MNKRRRILVLLAAVLMMFSMTVPAMAASLTTPLHPVTVYAKDDQSIEKQNKANKKAAKAKKDLKKAQKDLKDEQDKLKQMQSTPGEYTDKQIEKQKKKVQKAQDKVTKAQEKFQEKAQDADDTKHACQKEPTPDGQLRAGGDGNSRCIRDYYFFDNASAYSFGGLMEQSVGAFFVRIFYWIAKFAENSLYFNAFNTLNFIGTKDAGWYAIYGHKGFAALILGILTVAIVAYGIYIYLHYDEMGSHGKDFAKQVLALICLIVGLPSLMGFGNLLVQTEVNNVSNPSSDVMNVDSIMRRYTIDWMYLAAMGNLTKNGNVYDGQGVKEGVEGVRNPALGTGMNFCACSKRTAKNGPFGIYYDTMITEETLDDFEKAGEDTADAVNEQNKAKGSDEIVDWSIPDDIKNDLFKYTDGDPPVEVEDSISGIKGFNTLARGNGPWYRYHYMYFPMLFSLGALAAVYIMVAVRVLRLVFDLAFSGVIAPLFAAADFVSGGAKTKEIVKNIISIYLALMFIPILLSLYSLGMQWILGSNFSLLFKMFVLFIWSWATIDGPNILQRLIGQDVGLQDGWRAMMAGRAAVKDTTGAVKNVTNRAHKLAQKGNQARKKLRDSHAVSKGIKEKNSGFRDSREKNLSDKENHVLGAPEKGEKGDGAGVRKDGSKNNTRVSPTGGAAKVNNGKNGTGTNGRNGENGADGTESIPRGNTGQVDSKLQSDQRSAVTAAAGGLMQNSGRMQAYEDQLKSEGYSDRAARIGAAVAMEGGSMEDARSGADAYAQSLKQTASKIGETADDKGHITSSNRQDPKAIKQVEEEAEAKAFGAAEGSALTQAVKGNRGTETADASLTNTASSLEKQLKAEGYSDDAARAGAESAERNGGNLDTARIGANAYARSIQQSAKAAGAAADGKGNLGHGAQALSADQKSKMKKNAKAQSETAVASISKTRQSSRPGTPPAVGIANGSHAKAAARTPSGEASSYAPGTIPIASRIGQSIGANQAEMDSIAKQTSEAIQSHLSTSPGDYAGAQHAGITAAQGAAETMIDGGMQPGTMEGSNVNDYGASVPGVETNGNVIPETSSASAGTPMPDVSQELQSRAEAAEPVSFTESSAEPQQEMFIDEGTVDAPTFSEQPQAQSQALPSEPDTAQPAHSARHPLFSGAERKDSASVPKQIRKKPVQTYPREKFISKREYRNEISKQFKAYVDSGNYIGQASLDRVIRYKEPKRIGQNIGIAARNVKSFAQVQRKNIDAKHQLKK